MISINTFAKTPTVVSTQPKVREIPTVIAPSRQRLNMYGIDPQQGLTSISAGQGCSNRAGAFGEFNMGAHHV